MPIWILCNAPVKHGRFNPRVKDCTNADCVSSYIRPAILTRFSMLWQQQRNLANIYKAFTHCVSLLGEHGSACGRLGDLVSALFEFRFQQHSELVVTSFTQLLWFVFPSHDQIMLLFLHGLRLTYRTASYFVATWCRPTIFF